MKKVTEISTIELLEVHAINVFAPFILNTDCYKVQLAISIL